MAEPTDNGSSNPGQPPAGRGRSAACRSASSASTSRTCRSRTRTCASSSTAPASSPTLRVEVNVNATKMADKIFESAIDFKAEATSKAGVIYDLELAYAGLFEIQSMPEQALEPFLLINCPSLLFPVPAPPGGGPDARGRLPAAAARPDRFRRPLHAEAAAGRPGHQAVGELRDRLGPLMPRP